MKINFEEFSKRLNDKKEKVRSEDDLFRRILKFKIKINSIDGDLDCGFKIYTPDYSLMNDFNFSKFGYSKQETYCGPNEPYELNSESFIYKINFFSSLPLFEKTTFYLDDPEIEKQKMDILYGFYWSKLKGNFLSFPKESSEMKIFFLEKNMDENLVKNLIKNVDLVRETLP